jgi:uncharacterized protein YdhG (YjbR/CyaY superfamily)
MPKRAFRSVDEYLAAQPETTRLSLERVRAAIRKALPKAEETISYNIPTYRLSDKAALYFAGWKRHFSLYPVNDELVTHFGDELAGCELDKGTIRFPLDKPVPATLIGRIAKFRAAQVRKPRPS